MPRVSFLVKRQHIGGLGKRRRRRKSFRQTHFLVHERFMRDNGENRMTSSLVNLVDGLAAASSSPHDFGVLSEQKEKRCFGTTTGSATQFPWMRRLRRKSHLMAERYRRRMSRGSWVYDEEEKFKLMKAPSLSGEKRIEKMNDWVFAERNVDR